MLPRDVRHTIAFQATGFQAAPVDVQIEVPEGEEGPTPEQIPTAVLVFLGGPSVQVSAFVSQQDAANLMDAFTQAGDDLSRLVLVTDCMSPVTGFQDAYTDFLARMKARGLSTAVAAEVIAELRSSSH